MIRVCLVGVGKTGKEIAKVLLEQEDIKLVAAVCSPESPKEGKDLGKIIGCSDTGIIVRGSDKLEEVIFKSKPDVVVDFSTPEATMRNAIVFSKMKVNIVIATTGFSNLALKKLFAITRKYRTGIVYAPNITLGVNVLMLLASIASSILNNYDFQITEIHHKKKKDAPSGTALKIAREIEKGIKSSGRNLSHSNTPITAIRAGGVIGRHEVMIVGEEDKIEISHESFSRRAFALGALRAVRFIHRKTGYFEMSDVLNLNEVLGKYIEKKNNETARRFKHYAEEEEDSEEESMA